MIVKKNESRLVFSFGPKGVEYIHPSMLDNFTSRDKAGKVQPKSEAKSR